MKRNPTEEMIKEYQKRIRYRKIFPILSWYRCDKCGNEFIREKMYSFEKPLFYRGVLVLQSIFNVHKYGCKRCFVDISDFREYCNKRFVLSEDQIKQCRVFRTQRGSN